MRRWILPIALAVAMSGCATITPDYRKVGSKLNGLDLTTAAHEVPPGQGSKSAVQAFTDRRAGLRHGSSTLTALESSQMRSATRDFVYRLVARSDRDCEDYLIGVSAAANQTRAGLGVTGLALTSAGAIATPDRSSRLLNQLGALTGSTTTALNDTVFAGRDFQIIYTAVQTGRRAERARIYQAIEAGTYDAWGTDSLIGLVTPYHLNCGINYGLQQIAEAVEIQARAPGQTVVPPPPPPPNPLQPVTSTAPVAATPR